MSVVTPLSDARVSYYTQTLGYELLHSDVRVGVTTLIRYGMSYYTHTLG
jgi:hypothetical protein